MLPKGERLTGRMAKEKDKMIYGQRMRINTVRFEYLIKDQGEIRGLFISNAGYQSSQKQGAQSSQTQGFIRFAAFWPGHRESQRSFGKVHKFLGKFGNVESYRLNKRTFYPQKNGVKGLKNGVIHKVMHIIHN